jgi:hypothetical protein
MKVEEGMDCTLSVSGGRNMVYRGRDVVEVVRVVKVCLQ